MTVTPSEQGPAMKSRVFVCCLQTMNKTLNYYKSVQFCSLQWSYANSCQLFFGSHCAHLKCLLCTSCQILLASWNMLFHWLLLMSGVPVTERNSQVPTLQEKKNGSKFQDLTCYLLKCLNRKLGKHFTDLDMWEIQVLKEPLSFQICEVTSKYTLDPCHFYVLAAVCSSPYPSVPQELSSSAGKRKWTNLGGGRGR